MSKNLTTITFIKTSGMSVKLLPSLLAEISETAFGQIGILFTALYSTFLHHIKEKVISGSKTTNPVFGLCGDSDVCNLTASIKPNSGKQMSSVFRMNEISW